MEQFDLIVLGAGSAGYAAARVAATEHRARVALVDKGPLGGLCILAGCMPSKALLQSSKVAHLVAHAAEFGLEVPSWKPEFERIMARKDRLIEGFARYRREGIEDLPNTEVVMGEARFVGPTTVQVGDRTLTAPKIVLALGSKPFVPPVPGLDEAGYLLSDHMLTFDHLPESLAVIGGGIIALELGQFFARLGVKITIIEAAERLLSREDADVAEVMAARMATEGLTVLTGVKPFHIEKRGERKAVCFDHPDGRQDEVVASEVVVATGREPAVQGLDLEAAGVQMKGRRMVLNRCLQTTNPHIYAAGDVTGISYLVHVAIAEGELAARNAMMGCAPTPAPDTLYISAAFTEPNIARVGLSELEAEQLGREVLVGKYRFADHGKAEILAETDGFVKLLADPRSGELLGATVVGPEGAELIHELAVALTARMTIEQFLRVPHIHPTLAEIWTYPAEDILEQMRTRSRLEFGLMPSGYSDVAESAAVEDLEAGARLNVTRLEEPQAHPTERRPST